MSDRRRWIAHGAAATVALGELVGRHAEPGLLVGLTGPLGAGKTTFVQGVARGLDVPEDVPVTSPTFALVQHYPGRLPLVHVDAYRLGPLEDLKNVDVEDWLGGDGVTVVEWADRVADVLPEGTLWCRISHQTPESRAVEFFWHSPLQNQALILIICDAPPMEGLEPVPD